MLRFKSSKALCLFIFILSLGFLFSGCPGIFSGAQNWRRAAEKTGKPLSEDGKLLTESAEYWLRKVEGFKELNPGEPEHGIVFLGDSITERAPFKKTHDDLPVINRGIGGDKIGGWIYYGLLDRLDSSVFDLEPQKVFVMIGINDVVYAGTPPSNMRDNLDRLFERLREKLPEAELYAQSVLPARGGFAKHNPEILKFNKYIKKSAKKHGFKYVDLHRWFANDDGELKKEYASDALHLNEKGYRVWSRILLPYIYR